MDTLIATLVAYLLYVGLGFLLLYLADLVWPDAVTEFAGRHPIGWIFCLFLWPWSLAVIATLALSGGDDEEDEHASF